MYKGICALLIAASTFGCADKSSRHSANNTIPSTPTNTATYDDFSSGSLDLSKWEVRPDPQGQPLMPDHGVRIENNNSVFHTENAIVGDQQVYLVPKRIFRSGDHVEYFVDVKSASGHWGNLLLVQGSANLRFGMVGFNNGPQPYDELGLSHMSIDILADKIFVQRKAPSGTIYSQNVSAPIGGSFELYIGSFTGHNGTAHIDYDDFSIN